MYLKYKNFKYKTSDCNLKHFDITKNDCNIVLNVQWLEPHKNMQQNTREIPELSMV